MQAPALPSDESARLAALTALDVLDSAADPVLDGLVQCATAVTGCPIALVSLLDVERQWFKARAGLAAAQTPREQSFCGHSILQDELFEVSDARLDARFADNPLVTGEPHVIFYAGMPISAGGHKLGTLCVIDHVPRRLSAPQRKLLAALSKAVEHWFESRREHLALLERVAALEQATPGRAGAV